MSTLTITITKSPAGVMNTASTMEFAGRGGSIGRAADNAWILEDPERFISGAHAEIMFEQGTYSLVDRSTNGTFYNGSLEPIGKGNRITLKDGDHFSLGDYEFSVAMAAGAAAASVNAPIFTPPVAPAGAGPFADLGLSPSANVDPLASPLSATPADPFTPAVGMTPAPQTSPLLQAAQNTDPLAALGASSDDLFATPSESSLFSSSYADQAEPLAQSFSLPSAAPNAIPEDWDLDFQPTNPAAPVISPAVAAPAVERAQLAQLQQTIESLQAENRALQAQLQQAQAAVATQLPVAGSAANNDQLLSALGLQDITLDERKRAELGAVAGAFIRETIQGMMQVLSSRNTIKNEFRMNVTTIQPVENNPLKFSASLEEAIENMFVKEGNAYKKPVEAIQEGFQGISEHQIAVLAGIRAAFTGGIERFDPEALEQRFSKYQKSGLLQVGKKGKNWDFYKEYYAELVNDMDGSFRHMFGDEFVQAYEDQLQRLAISRKTEQQ